MVSLIVFFFLVHITLVKASLRVFVCTAQMPISEEEDVSYLVADTRVICHQGEHETWKWMGGLMLVVYGLGIPGLALAIVFHYRHRLDEVRCCLRFIRAHYVSGERWHVRDAVYCSACDRVRYAPSSASSLCTTSTSVTGTSLLWCFARRSLLPLVCSSSTGAKISRPVLSAVLRSTICFESPETSERFCQNRSDRLLCRIARSQAYAGLIVLFASYTLQIKFKPYREAVINRLEERALLTAILTLFCGAVLFSPNSNKTLRQFLTFIILAVNALCLLDMAMEFGKAVLARGAGKFSGSKMLNKFSASFRRGSTEPPDQLDLGNVELQETGKDATPFASQESNEGGECSSPLVFSNSNPMRASAKEVDALPNDWREIFPAGGGPSYFHNDESGETTWDRPCPDL